MAKKQQDIKIIWYILVVIADAVAIGWGWMYPVKLSLFFLLQVAAIYYFDGRKNDWRWLFMAALGGVVVELMAVWGGALSYAAPFKFGLPIWLAVACANGGLLLRRLVEKSK